MSIGSFPNFTDGDVEILLSRHDKFVLHSHVLAKHSKWFESSLAERWKNRIPIDSSVPSTGSNAPVGRQTSDTSRLIRSYELRFDKGSDVGMLAATDDDKNARFVIGGPHWLSNLPTEHDNKILLCFNAHEEMLKAMYHVPFKVHTASGHLTQGFLEEVEPKTRALREVGIAYSCEEIVDSHIQQAFTTLYREAILADCTHEPAAMLEVAKRYKTDWIFKEAGAHLIGSSTAVWLNAEGHLHRLRYADLFFAKRADFMAQLDRTVLNLFIMRIDDNVDGRTTFLKLAVAYFRHWLAARIFEDDSTLLANYGEVFHKIAEGRYYDEEFEGNVNRYVRDMFDDGPKLSPDSRERVELEEQVSVVFDQAKHIVEEIVRIKTSAEVPDDVESGLPQALTFVEIEDADIPW
ncbi:hypothetical protein LTR09_008693 [Extremus antarcticus]|uniref:BTB domain-containing protein n=1 Tax=Extremus antarcticus TaxID=702011 RepID=A0AAJ0DH48_9PEZI|nr:hypothetical protein LTR09_008693 [Extremus antarcticus]